MLYLLELRWPIPISTGGFMASFVKFGHSLRHHAETRWRSARGILTAIIFNALTENAPAELKLLGMEA
jgi:hypothetical protein